MGRKEGDYKKKRRKDRTDFEKERTKKRVTQVEKVEGILKEKRCNCPIKEMILHPKSNAIAV